MPEPLEIIAHLAGPVALPGGTVALDALLMAAVAARDGIPPPPPFREIAIPVEIEPGRSFHLASFSHGEAECYQLRYVNRRFPLEQAQGMAVPKVRRINLAGGPCKSYRLPLETHHLVGDRLTWWCVGERKEIVELLALVHYVGKKRSTGLGRVRQWTVDPCETWEGFPVVRDGKPLRTLPADWPGLLDPPLAWKVLTPPYWQHEREQLCAVMP